ncbi:MAG: type II toxin-antitoxin system VapC family toxin [Planctomycetota bacterium]
MLDASITVGSCVGEPEARAVAEVVMDLLRDGAVVAPGIWLGEVANALLSKERSTRPGHRLERVEVDAFLDLLERLPVVVDEGPNPLRLGAVVAVARDTGLTVYDAHYLELAQRLGLPLASLDADLCESARVAGIEVLDEESLPPWKHQ